MTQPLPSQTPGDATTLQTRQDKLAQAQATYEWDWSWPPGCATLSELPVCEKYPPDFVALITSVSILMAKNHAATTIAQALLAGPSALALPPLPPPPHPTSADDLHANLFAAAQAFHQHHGPRDRPATPDGYAAYYATIQQTPIVTRQLKDPACTDALFAWQRVAGCNPMSLRQIKALPADLRLSEDDWKAVVGTGSLAAALDNGQVYAVDFTMLHGVPATRYLGRQKYVCGARGIFTTRERSLVPVGIQLEPGGPVITPRDGTKWAMARYFLQVADANIHETMEHLGRTHMVMEAVGVSAHRQLDGDHPLWLLLQPHLIGTFAINASAKTGLIAPKGVIDQVFAARIDVAASLVRLALDGFVLQDCAPTKEIAARGLNDVAAIDYPYRDDILPVYRAIERFVRSYILVYYPDDATVGADTELAAWVDEVGSPIGGALRGIRRVETVDGLVEWMANIIHVGSAQHAAVNFPQFPFFSWGASVGGAAWGPPPGHHVTEDNLLALMPPWDCIFLQADTVFQLASVHYTRLGDYTFQDTRLSHVVAAFQADLATIDAEIETRDASRFLTYPFLRPSLVPASINI